MAQKRFYRRFLFWLVLVLLVGTGGGTWWWFKHRQPTPPKYNTTKLVRGNLIQAVTATGQLQPLINVQVGSQISGTIKELFADFNSVVKAGQVLARIDAATYEAAVQQATGDVVNAQAALELAQVNAHRSEELLRQKLIPQSDYDTKVAALHQAEAAVLIRQAALDRAKVDLARCTIYSPVDGSVISRNVDVGQTVAASLSAPTLFVIANDLTKMQINADVSEADIGGVEVGQAVDFTVDAFPNRTFTGTVTQVRNAAAVVQNVVTYDVIVGVANPEMKLRPGMTANISVIIARQDGVVKVPNAAFRFRPPDTNGGSRDKGGPRPGGSRPSGGPRLKRTLYRLENGQPVAVEVRTGITDGTETEALDGVAEGDEVITSQQMAEAAKPAASPFGGMRRF